MNYIYSQLFPTRKYKNDKFVEAIKRNANKLSDMYIFVINKPALANFASAFSNSFNVAIA